MNRLDPKFDGLAVVRYGDAEFTLIQPGSHVLCAVTQKPIPLAHLRYWNVERQEAYADATAALSRWRELRDES
ncbi:MAG: DUF2093 domain-containing protein [Maricaulaceae bacterium]